MRGCSRTRRARQSCGYALCFEHDAFSWFSVPPIFIQFAALTSSCSHGYCVVFHRFVVQSSGPIDMIIKCLYNCVIDRRNLVP